jgi:hypothetical protein
MNPIIKAALRDANVLRAAFGMPPLRSLPKGNLHQLNSCPIANALDATEVCPTDFQKNVDGFIISLRTPRSIARFIKAFDNGQYSRLVVK